MSDELSEDQALLSEVNDLFKGVIKEILSEKGPDLADPIRVCSDYRIMYGVLKAFLHSETMTPALAKIPYKCECIDDDCPFKEFNGSIVDFIAFVLNIPLTHPKTLPF